MSKITNGFEDKWKAFYGQYSLPGELTYELLAHARALEDMLRKIDEQSIRCPICRANDDHSPGCPLAKLLE